MNEVFKSKLEEIMPAEELLFPPTPGFGPYKSYLEHAVPHPAKMNTLLLEWLVRAFSEPGDTLLDPMAGSGSLGVVAYLHGRNAIQVELEKRFYDWMEKAREKVEAEGRKHGWIKNICGDARRLSELLSQADICITSPPYASTEFYYGEKPQEFWQTLANTTGRKAWANPQSKTRRTISAKEEPLSESNIANLPHGSIDVVLTSPPYSDTYIGGGDPEKRKERLIKAGHDPKDFLGGKARNAVLKHYNEVDTVITSPPYCDTISRQGGPTGVENVDVSTKTAREYSPKPENIGNLPLGEISAIVTSPPYSESMTKRRKGYTVIPELEKTREMPQDTRDDNIANLPHGNIDTIITSPPYLKSAEEGAGINKQREGGIS